VAWVNSGLKSSKYYDLAKEYLPKGQNGIVTFGLREVLKQLRLLLMKRNILANIGDTKSLIIHPASTTHQQLSVEEQAATGLLKI
jgi:O-acetylhomoserine (thiol)-lyase